jgi:hypothetical protein
VRDSLDERIDRRRDYGARRDFDNVCRQIEARVRRVCSHWPDEEILALTRRMARVHLKYRHATWAPGDEV